MKPTGPFLSPLSQWNLAAINNNPFEYWLTHPDATYAELMSGVQEFIEAPGENDVVVGEVFTSKMFDQLNGLMDRMEGWGCAEEVRAAYEALADRKIVSGFLKDADLGSKRLMSMPDRMTNTIDLANGNTAYRPSVISSFAGDMLTTEAWWAAWKSFMFERPLELAKAKGAKLPAALLTTIPRSKYPALSEEEEAMSLRLQTVCLAIFDAILVHMLRTLSPDGKWLELKRQIVRALLEQKEAKTIAVLTGPYARTSLLFLQEVRTASATKSLPAALPEYVVAAPAKPSRADQNSVICLSRAAFDAASVADVTTDALALLPAEGTQPADGDLLVITASDRNGRAYLLASFHGDTDGLATAPTLHAVHALSLTLPSHRLVFGLDANTYAEAKPLKQASAESFVADVRAKNLATTSGDTRQLTTYNARTYLQPQLQKACGAAQMKERGDCNPKDYILYSPAAHSVVEFGADNTAKRAYDDELVLPTLEWPSDHGLVYSTLLPLEAGSLPEPKVQKVEAEEASGSKE